jgi:hypothetical protein
MPNGSEAQPEPVSDEAVQKKDLLNPQRAGLYAVNRNIKLCSLKEFS